MPERIGLVGKNLKTYYNDKSKAEVCQQSSKIVRNKDVIFLCKRNT